jgi:hypothetical protein
MNKDQRERAGLLSDLLDNLGFIMIDIRGLDCKDEGILFAESS